VSSQTADERTARPRHAGATGRHGLLVVSDYVGQPAAGAAQLVRRAGLRPGLDRAYGYEAELLGSVVAQEPMGGSELARNAIVTLYVAAPGHADAADPDMGADAELEPSGAATKPAPRASQATRESEESERSAPATIEMPGPAAETAVSPPPIGAEQDARNPPTDTPGPDDQRRSEYAPPPEPDDYEPGPDDVFAVRPELPPWHRAYPRRPLSAIVLGPIGRARRHPMMTLACAVLLVWVMVAAAGALERSSTQSAAHRGVASYAGPTRLERAPGSRRAERTPKARRAKTGARRHRRAGAGRAERQRLTTAADAPVPSVEPGPRRPATAPETPTAGPAQSNGGPFSP